MRKRLYKLNIHASREYGERLSSTCDTHLLYDNTMHGENKVPLLKLHVYGDIDVKDTIDYREYNRI